MPNQRGKGQKLVPVPMSERFLAEIDRAFRLLGYDDRSKFIRAAVREKLQRMGYPVEKEETMAPPRTRPARYPGPAVSGLELNEPAGPGEAAKRMPAKAPGAAK